MFSVFKWLSQCNNLKYQVSNMCNLCKTVQNPYRDICNSHKGSREDKSFTFDNTIILLESQIMYGSREDKYLQICGHFMYTWSELFTWSELSSQTSTSYPCSLYYAWSVTMIHVKNKLFTEINMSYHLKYFTDIHVKKNTFTSLSNIFCWEYNIRSLNYYG